MPNVANKQNLLRPRFHVRGQFFTEFRVAPLFDSFDSFEEVFLDASMTTKTKKNIHSPKNITIPMNESSVRNASWKCMHYIRELLFRAFEVAFRSDNFRPDASSLCRHNR